MEVEVETPSLSDIKEALLLSFLQCNLRGLIFSANWAIELANSFDVECPVSIPTMVHSAIFTTEYPVYCMGKSLYDLREFRRASYVLRNCTSDEAFFLRNYCLYMAGEKDKEDNMVDAFGPHKTENVENAELHLLKKVLAERAASNTLDGYGYYLYGIVLRELCNEEEARKMLLTSLSLTPLLWCSWLELAKLCKDREMLYSFKVPNHWLRDFFYAGASLELRLAQDALSFYNNLSLVGFSRSSYITAQLAMAHYHLKNYSEASNTFSLLRTIDPYCTSNMNTYSDVLFVMERLPELSYLAQDLVKIDPYASVSCSVLGNFYSLRGNHEMAIVYFQRAVRLDKDNFSAWILLGHEFIEQKNCSMAIEAYSKGLEANKHDFRSYYGLGHTYEILRMPFFAIHYYKQAHKLRSSDTNILYALGTCYAELNQNDETKKCLMRAIALKDQEGMSLIKLAKLHAKLNEEEDAVKLYTRFIAQAESSEVGVHLPKEQGPAHLYLARYHMNAGSYREAEAHAHKSTEFVATREEGKSLLQEVMKKPLLDSSGNPVAVNLGSLSDIELSPITASSNI